MPDRDRQLRLAAFARLEELTRVRGGLVTSEDLEAGFNFDGERIKFWSSRRGIWRPKQLAVGRAGVRPVQSGVRDTRPRTPWTQKDESRRVAPPRLSAA